MLNENFHKIDLKKWDRSQYFYYFTKMLPTGYSISVNIDVTNTYNRIKSKQRKFFPAYLYVASKIISEMNEFRVASLNDELGYYEVLHPSYAILHKDDNTMSNMWTEYDDDFDTFYKNYMNDQNKYGDNHGPMAKTEMSPQNSFMIGMLPWIEFSSYTPVPFVPMTTYSPILQGGKFFEKDNRKIMPFSITVHHAVADGYHVGLFLEKFQEYMNLPERWMR